MHDQQIIELILGPGGLCVFLLVTVWAFATRRVISRGSYDEVVQEKNEWKQIALHNLQIAEKGVGVIEEKV